MSELPGRLLYNQIIPDLVDILAQGKDMDTPDNLPAGSQEQDGHQIKEMGINAQRNGASRRNADDIGRIAESKDSQNQRLMMTMWLIDLMNVTMTASRLKLILPFVLSLDLVASSVPPMTNMLQAIAERLGGPKSTGVTSRPESTSASQTSLADMESGFKLPVPLLIQTQVSLLSLYGAMEDCYIHLMNCGGIDDPSEGMLTARKKTGLKYTRNGEFESEKKAPPLVEKEIKGRYRLTEATEKPITPQTSIQNVFMTALLEENPQVPNGQTHIHSSSLTSKFEQNIDTVKQKPAQIDIEVAQDKVDKKKKKGLKNKLMAPFRWINKTYREIKKKF